MSTVQDIHVGKPPASFIPVYDSRVHFHDFSRMSQPTYSSSAFMCANNCWTLEIHPGSEGGSSGMVGVYLCSKSKPRIVVDFSISFKDDIFGEEIARNKKIKQEFMYPGIKCGWNDFVTRKKLLSKKYNVRDGALTIEVRIRPHSDYFCRRANRLPSVGVCISSLFDEKNTADVAFQVKDQVLYAHKWILQIQAPDLADLCDLFDKTNPFPIEDVNPKLFRNMLRQLYGCKEDVHFWKDQAKQIIEVSSKYGFNVLREKAEAWYAHDLKLTVNNVVDELLTADSMSCSLIKKAAMDFIVKHGVEVVESDSFRKLDDSRPLALEVTIALAKALDSRRKRPRDE
ncbi:hypothetical protein ACHAW6_004535 [Cyclotella cf. meneghiniana]